MNKTGIEWTTFSANPLKYRRKSDGKTVWACVKCSPGCANCYSEAIALRWEKGKLFNAKNMEELEPFLDDAELRKMLNARTIGGVPVAGSRCFVGDMTDVFGEWVPGELLDRLFAVFALRSDVTWQVLTKRAGRMAAYLREIQDDDKDMQRWANAACDVTGSPCACNIIEDCNWPLPNVWLGVSVEDQQRADERIPLLLQCPAAVRFLSCEPLLGPVNLREAGPLRWDVLSGWKPAHGDYPEGCNTDRVDWCIVGGESGRGARFCDVENVRSIVRQCKEAGVACFVKQMGSAAAGVNEPWVEAIRDPKGGDPSEWPADLRVREFPH